MEGPCLLAFTPTGGQVEYLESVSRTATTWTTDPHMAIHFINEKMLPTTTVLLRFPMLEALPSNATESQKTVRIGIERWLEAQGKVSL